MSDSKEKGSTVHHHPKTLLLDPPLVVNQWPEITPSEATEFEFPEEQIDSKIDAKFPIKNKQLNKNIPGQMKKHYRENPKFKQLKWYPRLFPNKLTQQTI